MAIPSAPISAISGESVDHSTPLVMSALEPSLYFPIALNCMLSLTPRVELGELTETEFRGDSPLHCGSEPVHVGLLLPQAARQRQAKNKRNFLIRGLRIERRRRNHCRDGRNSTRQAVAAQQESQRKSFQNSLISRSFLNKLVQPL